MTVTFCVANRFYITELLFLIILKMFGLGTDSITIIFIILIITAESTQYTNFYLF